MGVFSGVLPQLRSLFLFRGGMSVFAKRARRSNLRILIIGLLLLPTSAFAQTYTDYDGTFSVSWSVSNNYNGGIFSHVTVRQTSPTSVMVGGGSTTSGQTNTLTRPNGTYVFNIESCYTFNSPPQCHVASTKTYIVSIVTAPPANPPATFTVPATDADGVYTISWSTTADTETYEIQERVNGGAWSTLRNTSGTMMIFSGSPGSDRPAKGNGSYGYQVRSCNALGCSSYTSVQTTDVAIAPGVPVSISVPGSTYGPYTVSWGAASGSVTNYDLDIRKDSGGYTDQYYGNSLSTAGSISEAGTYYFRVRACRTTVTYTNCSDWRTSSGMAAALPPVPGSFTVPETNSSGSYSVSWDGISGVSKYTLQERIGSRLWTTVQDSAATSRSFSGKGNSRYSYRVRSCTAVGCSAYTSAQTVNVVRARTGAATETVYVYDALGRLQFIGDSLNSNRDFDYDKAGNRTAVAEGVLDEDEDPFAGEIVPLAAPTGLSLQGPLSQFGGYNASWSGVASAGYYVVGMEDGSQVQVTGTSISTAILRPVWVYAANYSASSAKSYF